MRKLPKRYSKKSRIIMGGEPASGHTEVGCRWDGSRYTRPVASSSSASGPTTLRQLKWSLILGALFWAWWLTAGKDVGLDVFVRQQVHDTFGPTSGKRLE